MQTPGSVLAFHALAAFLAVGFVECCSVKDESLLLSNHLDDVDDPEVNEEDDMRCMAHWRLRKTYVTTAEKIARSITRNGRRKGTIAQILNGSGHQFKAIFPGTAWCGDGDIAKHPDDLGLFEKTDRCCRAHDHCPEYISARRSKHGLRNNGLFTRSHCDCDLQFFNCLHEVKSTLSFKIGYTYFNVLSPQCFKNDYPAKCRKYVWSKSRKKRCVDYSYDMRKGKIWQWFDSPEFSFKR